MKYIKKYETVNNFIQQPFYLSNGDILYISDDLTKKITPTEKELSKIYTKESVLNYKLNQQRAFFTGERNEKGFRVSTRLDLFKNVVYNDFYKMNIVLYSRQEYLIKGSGNFKYYIGGNSGDYEMHSKNMIRATRECNLNFISLYYPIVKHIENFYKKLKGGELFFDIIKNDILKQPEIAKYGIPEELRDELGHYKTSIKYNL